MKVIISKYIGACSGVKSALKKVKESIKNISDTNIVLEHSLAHNEALMKDVFSSVDYELLNSSRDNVTLNDIFIISAHGHDFEYNIPTKNIIDCTCSWLKFRLDELIEKYNNRRILYLGVKDHPETIHNLSRLKKSGMTYLSFDNINDIFLNYKSDDIILVQSTFIINEDDQVKLESMTEKSFLTCPFVMNRFKELNESLYGTIIVIGSKTSSNCNALFKRAKKNNDNSYFINSKDEVNSIKNLLEPVFITSGTSTPQFLIEEITDYIKTI